MKIKWQIPTRQQFLVTAFVALASYPFFYVVWSGSAILPAIFAGATGGYAEYLRQRYATSLLQRISATDGGPSWDVVTNGVKVGTIKDSEYAAIRLKIFTNLQIYVAQAFNLGNIAMRGASYLFQGIPLFAFWAMIACAIFSPGDFSNGLAQIQKAGPDEIAEAVRWAVQLFGVGLVVSMFIQFAVGGASGFGFINRFSEATNLAVRVHCGAAAEGDMSLVRYADGAVYLNDEMAYVKAKG